MLNPSDQLTVIRVAQPMLLGLIQSGPSVWRYGEICILLQSCSRIQERLLFSSADSSVIILSA